jgi:galactonate dehydratase
MKVTQFELFKVPPRWLFLKVSTDEGLVGWGEPLVESKPDTTAAAVRELSPLVIGRDPHEIEDIVQVVFKAGFYRGGPVLSSALAGIEQALWDIKGKALGVPVHQLLGGKVRDRIRIYAWMGGDLPEQVSDAELREQAAALKATGVTALKMNLTGALGHLATPAQLRAAIHRATVVREAVGDDFDIAIDFHGRVHRAAARQLLRELEPLRPFFVEEAVLPEHSDLFAELAASTTIPLAAGERLFHRWDFTRVLGSPGLAIIQPDLSHACGIWEVRKIAAMAEAYDVAVAPHCPLGPLTLAASLQLDACTPNFLIQEQSMNIHYNVGGEVADYLTDPSVFTFKDGCIHVPTGPGLGVTINEDAVRAATKKPHTFAPSVLRLADGTYAEW